ncbi:DUF4097 family beta strand repeat-containing protein [Paludicola sp. MB14-C6]|uniref:DUF4097 family beta strand repeat-containing protein n=1 Tax=Paludihabitans sp. MB14-C6 TaxID=3070656 RepID=UPI0027DE8D91|nr:DUF4097 family beta strand repeat-containing protein [Paludicola sp. MB14-C6]WMJ21815.1 DUF4097 family beta strand repeat-containing protein [Paludicola sp. MB14-C6]
MNKAIKILSIIGGSLLLVGFVLAVLSFSILGFDYRKLNASEPSEKKIEHFSANSIQTIKTDFNDKKIIVRPTDNKDITLTYYQSKREPFTINQDGDTLSLANSIQNNEFNQIRFGIFFGVSQISSADVIIDVPSNYSGNFYLDTSNGSVEIANLSQAKAIDVHNSNGSIALRNLKCTTLKARSSNSSISIENVVATDSIIANSSNGKLKLTQVTANSVNLRTSNASIELINTTATTKMSAESSNGKISIDKVISNDIYLKSSNGSIKGTINGKQEEYFIKSDTSNSSSNLPNNWGKGPKKLEVETSNASINVEFVD